MSCCCLKISLLRLSMVFSCMAERDSSWIIRSFMKRNIADLQWMGRGFGCFCVEETVRLIYYWTQQGMGMFGNQYDTDSLLKNLMQNMTDMIYFKDLQSRFVLVNEATADWQGFAHPDDAIGTSDFDRYKEEDARRMFADEQRIIKTGQSLEGVEEQETRKNGEVAWVCTTKMPLEGPNGEIVGTFGVSRDITEHKEAELKACFYAAQVGRIKVDMEEDVRMAAELQRTFFPHSYPVYPLGSAPDQSCVKFHHYYRASGMVSGDFCAVRRISATESAIFQCDFMGHGVRAALGTAMIFAMIEENCLQFHQPGDFLKRMNELLLPILRQKDIFLFATACYAVFDASTGLLRMANAGHPVPLHFQALENSAQWLMDDASKRGPALAIAEDAEYQTEEKQLYPGDSVVMYTDGLYEVESTGGGEFGEERLLAAANRMGGLPLETLFPSLIREAGHFSGEGEFEDDVCLVGFTFRNPMKD